MASIEEPHYSFEDLVAATGTPLPVLVSIGLRVPGGPRPGTLADVTSMNLRVAVAIGAAAYFKTQGASKAIVDEVLRLVVTRQGPPTGAILRDGRRKPEIIRGTFERDFANATHRMSIPQLYDLDALRDRLDEALEARGGTSPWRGTPYA